MTVIFAWIMLKLKLKITSRKVSNAQEKVRGMLRAEFMKWIFRFTIIKLRFQLRYLAYEQQFKTWDKLLERPFHLWNSKNMPISQKQFLSFSQSLNKFLDCGASLSCPVRFDLCPTNPSVTVSFGRWAMRVSRLDGLRCDFSTNEQYDFIHQKFNFKLTFKQHSPWYQFFKQALCWCEPFTS